MTQSHLRRSFEPMQASLQITPSRSPFSIPPRRRDLRRSTGSDRRVARKHNILYRGLRTPKSSKIPSDITKKLEVVQTFHGGPDSSNHSGQSAPKHRSRAQKRKQLKSRRSMPSMAHSPSAQGRVGPVGAEHWAPQPSNATTTTTQVQPELFEERPRSANWPFLRESTHWARFNAKYIDDGEEDTGFGLRVGGPRLASEDLLRSQSSSAAPFRAGSEPKACEIHGLPDDKSGRTLKCLHRPHNTRNWLGLRPNNITNNLDSEGVDNETTPKVPVHQQVGRLMKKITDASNWAHKEPTASLREPGLSGESDVPMQTRPHSIQRKTSLRHITSLKERANNMHCFGAHHDTTASHKPDNVSQQNNEVINLNAAESNTKPPGKGRRPSRQDVEEENKRSVELSTVFTRHPPHSEHYLDLSTVLPDINTDAFRLSICDTRRNSEQQAPSAAAATRTSAGPAKTQNSMEPTV